MIEVTVGTNYLSHLFEAGRATFSSQVRGDIERLQKECLALRYIKVDDKNGLRKHSVYDLLDLHFRRLKQIVPGATLEAIRKEIEQTGQRDYHIAAFQATLEDAANSLAIHKVLPHALITGRATDGFPEEESVFCPDLAVGRSYWSFLGGEIDYRLSLFGALRSWAYDFVPLDQQIMDGLPDMLVQLQCHLCDSLETVYDRASNALNYLESRFNELAKDGWPESPLEVSLPFFSSISPNVLTIDPAVTGFQNHRIVRRANPNVPPIANHRLISRSALRQGIGMPVVSSLFPSSLWQAFNAPVKHFILSAAEQAGSQKCRPVYPDTPSRKEMDEVIASMEGLLAARVTGSNTPSSSQVDEIVLVLEKLGLGEVFEKSQKSPSDCDVIDAMPGLGILYELRSAIFNDDIEQSLRLQDVLDLYPLHKRVLGLVEYVLLRKIEEKFSQHDGKVPDAANAASGLWTVAFTGAEDSCSLVTHGGVKYSPVGQQQFVTRIYDPLIRRPAGINWQATWKQDGKKATLETEGNWLIAAAAAQGNSDALDLAELLDELVERRITKAPETGGTNCYLQFLTAGDHARQLGELTGLAAGERAEAFFRQARESAGTESMQLAYRGQPAPDPDSLANRYREDAACMTLYLGKLVLMLRNAIEHGTDQVTGEALLVDTTHYWEQKRAGKPILTWLIETARQVSWRSQASLPTTLPSAANAFLLTPASLHRCLALLSLVMHGAFSHLSI